ncbi:MAG: hypothetical protein JWO31_3901, partial [Phycisphaerales bacterium]|nr:hypothetical protein [Phycisphaerales bacterium]
PAAVGGAGVVGRATVKVYNLGLDTARGPLAIQLRFSANGTADLPDAVAADVAATIKIKPGAAKSFKVKFTYPDLPEGSYFLVAELDPLAVLTETNEANNVAASATAVRVSRAYVDVRTRLGATAATAQAGGPAAAAVVVYNDGNVPAAATMTVRVWAVPVGTPAAEAPAVGAPVYAAPVKLVLPPGRGRTVKLKFAFPADLAAGAYDLVASVDAGAAVGELDAANNASSGPTAVTIG